MPTAGCTSISTPLARSRPKPAMIPSVTESHVPPPGNHGQPPSALRSVSSRVNAAWTSFARTGNPNHDGLPAWPAYTADQRATMILNNECQVANDPNKDERQALIATPRVA